MKVFSILAVRGLQFTLLQESVKHVGHAHIVDSLSDLIMPLYLCYLAFHLLPSLGISMVNKEAHVRLKWLSIFVKAVVYGTIMYSAWMIANGPGDESAREILLIEAAISCIIMELVDQHFELAGQCLVPEFTSLKELLDEIKRVWNTIIGKE